MLRLVQEEEAAPPSQSELAAIVVFHEADTVGYYSLLVSVLPT